MASIASVTEGLHGSFAWSCVSECANDPNSDCGTVFIAGSDTAGGSHVYGPGCVEDVLTNPAMYSGEGLVLHGTHMLSDEEILEAYGPDRGMPPDDIDISNVTDVWRLSDGDDTRPDDTRLVAIAIDLSERHPTLISAAVLHELLKDPDQFDGTYTLYGTHILNEGDILHHYPDPDER